MPDENFEADFLEMQENNHGITQGLYKNIAGCRNIFAERSGGL
jgi:sarcosine oxidase delta subunit